jgi:hypothetical protein
MAKKDKKTGITHGGLGGWATGLGFRHGLRERLISLPARGELSASVSWIAKKPVNEELEDPFTLELLGRYRVHPGL